MRRVDSLCLVFVAVSVGACESTPSVPRAEREAIQYRCYGYTYGREGLHRDYAAAHEWCAQSAALGSSHGQTLYAELFYEGLGTERDYVAAARWYRSAADQWHPHAMLMLGRLYLRGHGVPTDRPTAAYWFALAAEHGSEAALHELSKLVSTYPSSRAGQ